MAGHHHDVAAFVAQLNELRELAGSPSLSELRKLSQGLAEGGRRPRVLAESTTHDILTGKRHGFPSWPWVASYVNACHRAAAETHLDVAELGSISDWNARWRAARTSEQTAPAAGSLPDDPVPAPEPTLTSSEEARPTRKKPDPPMSVPMRRYLRRFGRTGARLVRQAEAGDAQACLRLWVITLLGDQLAEAREWLNQAAAADNDHAVLLRQHRFHRAAATEYAYQYATAYEADGNKTSIAIFFYQLAGHHGHAGAAFQLGHIHTRRGDQWLAATWFSRAADAGHPHAVAHFNEISQQISNANLTDDRKMLAELAQDPPSPAERPPGYAFDAPRGDLDDSATAIRPPPLI